jgi:hypothetical protein
MTPGVIQELADLIQKGGPWTLVVIVALWALKKDRDKDRQAREFFTKMADLSEAHIVATLKMETAISALKEALQLTFERRRSR